MMTYIPAIDLVADFSLGIGRNNCIAGLTSGSDGLSSGEYFSSSSSPCALRMIIPLDGN